MTGTGSRKLVSPLAQAGARGHRAKRAGVTHAEFANGSTWQGGSMTDQEAPARAGDHPERVEHLGVGAPELRADDERTERPRPEDEPSDRQGIPRRD